MNRFGMKVGEIRNASFRATTAASNGAVFHKEMTACTWSFRTERKRKRSEAGFTARCEQRAIDRAAGQVRFSGRRKATA